MDYLESFLEFLWLEKKYSNHTIKAYQQDLVSFFDEMKFDFEVESAAEVDSMYVRKWMAKLKVNNYNHHSINRKLASLKTFYKYLLKLEVVEQSPVAQLKSLKAASKVLVPFNEREIDQALAYVDDSLSDFEISRNKLIIHFLYATGIRKSELINLMLKDVDYHSSTIRVLGKNNKERIVPVYKSLWKDIFLYLEQREMVKTTQQFFFITSKGSKLYNSLVYRLINSYFSKVTTKQKKSPHVLRHSYATDLVNNGANLNAVKELLGHSSLAATQVYTHNSLDKLKKVYNNAHPRSAKKT